MSTNYEAVANGVALNFYKVGNYWHGGMEDTPRIDLAPCPFCGCPSCELMSTHTPCYWVECPDCDAQGPVGLPNRGQGKLRTQKMAFKTHRQAIADAIEKWNEARR